MATKTDLIHRALRNLGALPMGQSPSAEESQSLSDLIAGLLAELEARDIVYIRDIDTYGLEDKYLQPIGHILAWRAAPEFGAASDAALATLAVQAELHLRNMESGRPTYQLAESDYF
jgi:hypothetical protein